MLSRGLLRSGVTLRNPWTFQSASTLAMNRTSPFPDSSYRRTPQPSLSWWRWLWSTFRKSWLIWLAPMVPWSSCPSVTRHPDQSDSTVGYNRDGSAFRQHFPDSSSDDDDNQPRRKTRYTSRRPQNARFTIDLPPTRDLRIVIKRLGEALFHFPFKPRLSTIIYRAKTSWTPYNWVSRSVN